MSGAGKVAELARPIAAQGQAWSPGMLTAERRQQLVQAELEHYRQAAAGFAHSRNGRVRQHLEELRRAGRVGERAHR